MKLYSAVLPIALGGLVVFVVFTALLFINTRHVFSGEEQHSVEIGLAELSPRGEAGGYAVPASGSSGSGNTNSAEASTLDPATFTLTVTPSSIQAGTDSQMVWKWNIRGWGEITRVVVQRCLAAACNWTTVSDVTGKSFGGGSIKKSCFIFFTCTVPIAEGTSPSYDTASKTLAAGTYTYRAVGYFANGTTIHTATQTVIGNGSDLTIGVNNYTTVSRGQSISVPYGIQNIGSVGTVSGFDTTLYFDFDRNASAPSCPPVSGNTNDFCVTTASPALAAATSLSVSATNVKFTTAGNWRVRGSVDTTNAVAESNEGNNISAWDDFVVTDMAPVATLYVRSQTAGVDWTTADSVTIPAGHQVQVKWDSNAQSCQGSNFNTSGAASNSEGVTPVAQPSEGAPVTYRLLNCLDSNGLQANSDQTIVQVVAAAPVLSAKSSTVRASEPFELTWDLNGNVPALCVITGPGSKVSMPGSITTNEGATQIDAAVSGAATYTLDCPGGDDTITIQVLPQVFET